MTPADLDAVLALQQRCYGVGLLERRDAFAAKLAVTEGLDCCWMAARGDEPLAYAVSLPVCEATLPALDAPYCEHPVKPTLALPARHGRRPRGALAGPGRTPVGTAA